MPCDRLTQKCNDAINCISKVESSHLDPDTLNCLCQTIQVLGYRRHYAYGSCGAYGIWVRNLKIQLKQLLILNFTYGWDSDIYLSKTIDQIGDIINIVSTHN